jgi:hypothetical protein
MPIDFSNLSADDIAAATTAIEAARRACEEREHREAEEQQKRQEEERARQEATVQREAEEQKEAAARKAEAEWRDHLAREKATREAAAAEKQRQLLAMALGPQTHYSCTCQYHVDDIGFVNSVKGKEEGGGRGAVHFSVRRIYSVFVPC